MHTHTHKHTYFSFHFISIFFTVIIFIVIVVVVVASATKKGTVSKGAFECVSLPLFSSIKESLEVYLLHFFCLFLCVYVCPKKTFFVHKHMRNAFQ